MMCPIHFVKLGFCTAQKQGGTPSAVRLHRDDRRGPPHAVLAPIPLLGMRAHLKIIDCVPGTTREALITRQANATSARVFECTYLEEEIKDDNKGATFAVKERRAFEKGRLWQSSHAMRNAHTRGPCQTTLHPAALSILAARVAPEQPINSPSNGLRELNRVAEAHATVKAEALRVKCLQPADGPSGISAVKSRLQQALREAPPPSLLAHRKDR